MFTQVNAFGFTPYRKKSHVQLSAAPWSIHSMEFSRPEYWSGLPFPAPGDLPQPGTEPRSPTLQADSFPAEPPGKPSQPEAAGKLSYIWEPR